MKHWPLLLLLAALALAGCGRSAHPGAMAAAGKSCCAAAAPAAAAAAAAAPAAAAAAPAAAAAAPRAGGASIYALDSSWRDQDGRALRLGELAGRPRVLVMVFTHCAYACPRILAELRSLEKELASPPDQGPGFVLVSFDTVRDDPATLAAYAKVQGLDLRRWTLLHGEAAAVRELSVVLDVPYRAEADGSFSHASVISVLDGEGRLVHQKRGLGGELDSCRVAMLSAH